MSYPNLTALLEAIIYVAKEPVSLDAIYKALPENSELGIRNSESRIEH